MKKHIRHAFPAVCAALLLCGCGYAGPEKAVRNELDLIQKLDETTIRSFVSYEDILQHTGHPSDINEETIGAVKLFFRDFSYHIDSSSQSSDGLSATVVVSITNLDARQLAKDLCMEMYRRSTDNDTDDTIDSLSASFSLIRECLETHEYPQVTTTAVIDLTKTDGSWSILESSRLEDELVGGLAGYLADPYLLTPEEILTMTLEPMLSFSSADWKEYMGATDIFQTGTDQAGTLDNLFYDRLSQSYAFEISNITQNGDEAEAEVLITSLDMNAVADACLPALLEFANTTESIRASEDDIIRKTADILIKALTDIDTTAVSPVTIRLTNNGRTWEPELNETFTNALFGDLNQALEKLSE